LNQKKRAGVFFVMSATDEAPDDPRVILPSASPAPWGFCRSKINGRMELVGGVAPGQRVGKVIVGLELWPNEPSQADRHLIEHAPDYARRVVDLEDAARELLAALNARDAASFSDLTLDPIEALTTTRVEHIKPVLDARKKLSTLLAKGPKTP
jgi:hypothetical protein